MPSTQVIIAAVIIVIIIAGGLWYKNYLNDYIPASMKHEGFVGNTGRSPAMQQCLKPLPGGGWFNQCLWV